MIVQFLASRRLRSGSTATVVVPLTRRSTLGDPALQQLGLSLEIATVQHSTFLILSYFRARSQNHPINLLTPCT